MYLSSIHNSKKCDPKIPARAPDLRTLAQTLGTCSVYSAPSKSATALRRTSTAPRNPFSCRPYSRNSRNCGTGSHATTLHRTHPLL